MSELTRPASELNVDSKRARLERLLRERAAGRPIGETGAEPMLRRGSRDGLLPLSFGQERLWFLEQLDPGRPTYNIPTVLELTGTLDLEALRWSVGEIVRRHEALRTTFAIVDTQLLQVIAPPGLVELPVIDLAHMPEPDGRREADRLADAEAVAPFDLGQGPLLRLALLRMGPSEHRLLVTMHHTVADGWSLGIFLRELGALYQARLSGSASPLPEPALQYADFAAWQRAWLTAERLEPQVAYWRERLGGIPPALELPTDHARPATRSGRGGAVTRILPAELGDALRGLARRERVTLFMVLLAGFKILLARHANAEDIVVGSPISGRTRRETEGLIGFFVNTLVLRTDLSGDPTVREVLQRVRAAALGAYAHQEVPFEKLVGEVKPERSLERTPLFQVMFNLVGFGEGDEIALPGLRMRLVSIERLERMADVPVKFDLTLYGREEGAAIRLVLEYNADLFERSTAERLLGRLGMLLAGMAADPDARLSALPLLTAAERTQLVEEWNGTAVAYPAARGLHEVIAAQAARTPGAVAVAAEGRALTYGELEGRANQVAHALRKRGVGPEVLVGIAMERSLELLVGVLGILKAGGAYVPIDPEYPAERVAYMLADAQVPVLLTQATLRERLPAPGAAVLCLDGDAEWLTREPTTAPEGTGGPEQLAYVIYTSGSTGRPKGAMNTHGGIGNRLQWMQATYGLTAADRVLQKTPISFDVSVWELFWPLMTGATLVLARPGGHRDPAYLVETIQRERITVVHFVPSMLQVFLAEPGVEGCGTVRQVICSGEALPYELAQRCMARLPAARLDNLYGPTEAAVDVTWWRCERDGPRGLVPIGKPVANTEIYIVDGQGQPVPVGVAGELCIGGVQVGRGYWRRPELTAERFVPDPFSGRPGARLYRTGDRARYLGDGNIEYLGRLDFQVKIRGFRIELGEIEAVLGQQPGVREAVVVAREDAPGRRELVAYIVPQRPQAPSLGELRDFLQHRLPDYMIPTAVVVLDVLPLTASGKVDRRAFPAPALAHRATASEHVLPRTPLEVTLARIWTEVLGVERVGIHDSFFGLGGDSILILQVIARARQAGLRVTAADMFRHPTIAGLVPFVASEAVPPAEQGMLTGPVALTPIQRWFFELNSVGPDHWNQAFRLAVADELEPPVLERALLELVRHHDALRLRYERTPEGWQQSYGPIPPSVDLKVVDVASLPDAEQDVATDVLGAEIGASLRLSDGRLVAAAYVRRGHPRGDRVLLAIHHLAVDGVSWRILLEDLERVYAQLRAGRPVALPPKTTSFKHWAERLAAHAQSEAVWAEMEHWASVGSVKGLPVDIEPPEPNTVESARTVSVTFDREETLALLQKVPAAYHTQLNEVLLTALVQATTEWTGRPALVLDLEGHGREPLGEETVDVSRTVGWFTTIFPVRLEVRTGAGPGEALKAVKEQLRHAPNRGLGYGLLRYMTRDAAIERQLRACGPADLLFNYFGQLDQSDRPGAALRLTDEPCGPLSSGQSTRHHLVEVNSWIVGGRLRVDWIYSVNVHRGASIERIAARFAEALRALLAHCLSADAGGYTPSDFPDAGLTQEELDAVLETLDEDGGASAVSRGAGAPVSDWRRPQ